MFRLIVYYSFHLAVWSQRPAGFLQCFDTVDWFVWPVKIVLQMTHEVSSGTINLYVLTSFAGKLLSSTEAQSS